MSVLLCKSIHSSPYVKSIFHTYLLKCRPWSDFSNMEIAHHERSWSCSVQHSKSPDSFDGHLEATVEW